MQRLRAWTAFCDRHGLLLVFTALAAVTLASAPITLPYLVRRLAVAAAFVVGAAVIGGVVSHEIGKGAISLYTHSWFYRETEPKLFWAAVAAKGIAAVICLVIAVLAVTSTETPWSAFSDAGAG